MNKKLLFVCGFIAVLCLLGCSQDIRSPMFNDHVLYMWAQTLEPYSSDIAFFGDSRVAGADWKEAYPTSDVVNLGIGGDIVEGTIQRLILLEALDVKYCFLAIGANNCSRSDFTPAAFRKHYDELLRGMKDLGITVYVNTIAGVTTTNSSIHASIIKRMNDNMASANAIIKELAKTHEMQLIDMATLMNDSVGNLKDEYSADGIHFSQAGNQVWFDTLRTYVEAST